MLYKCGKYTVESTKDEKIFFPPKITKGAMVEYYYRISSLMLAHIKHRPLTMQRYPDGIEGENFFHKDTPVYFPDYIKRLSVPKSDGGETAYTIAENEATLVYLANQGCITIHQWLSKADKLYFPDRMIFDLDPSVPGFEQIRKAAFEFKELLESENLTPYVMLTGSRGVHVVVPIKRTYDFETVKHYAQQFAEQMVQKNPDKYTTELRKDKRGKKIFIDTHRINFGATAVAPYSVRARPRAPVATPLTWQELENKKIVSDTFTIDTIFKLLDKRGDAWLS